MPKTVLSELELIGLIQDILSKGRSQNIREWMDQIPNPSTISHLTGYECFKYKDLGYMHFDLRISIFSDTPETSTVMKTFMELREKSKWFSQKECRRVLRLIVNTVMPRYAKAIEKNPETLSFEGGQYNFANETKVTLELHEKYNFVVFEFARIHD